MYNEKRSLPHIGIIGCGKLGSAILRGITDKGIVSSKNVHVNCHSTESSEKLKSAHGCQISTNLEIASGCDIIILGVKPYQLEQVLTEEVCTAMNGKLLISILAGVTTVKLGTILPGTRVVRAMPNTPCSIGAGMTSICAGATATEQDLHIVHNIFSSIGRCASLSETHFDIATAVAASGPAFFLTVLQAITDGAVALGMPPSLASELATQTMFGTAKMSFESNKTSAELRDAVVTPGGCTAEGVRVLEERKIGEIFKEVIEQTTRRAQELGNKK